MNTKMMDVLGDQQDKYPRYLEAHFPHVFQKMLELWNTPDGERYFDELMLSSRPDRRGFPPEATAEIWAMQRIHAALREAQQAIKQDEADIWTSGSDDAHHSRLIQGR